MAAAAGGDAASSLGRDATAALGPWLALALGARSVTIETAWRLRGGAVRENHALEVDVSCGRRAGRHRLVLRTDPPSSLPSSLGRSEEHAVQRLVHGKGLKVAEPWAVDGDGSAIGRPFMLMQWLPGEARGPCLVRDPQVGEAGEAVAATLGRELARLHRLPLPAEGLDFLSLPAGEILAARIGALRDALDAMGEAQPALEYGLRWLERHPPTPFGRSLNHGDLRTGNVLIDEGSVVAILDWEFAHVSDPLEDLGWLLARCWRYGRVERAAGGLGSRAALLAAYAAESGRQAPDPLDVARWELFATLRWGVIALRQAGRHESGAEPSLSLGLTRHVLPSLARDTLDYTRAIGEGRLL